MENKRLYVLFISVLAWTILLQEMAMGQVDPLVPQPVYGRYFKGFPVKNITQTSGSMADTIFARDSLGRIIRDSVLSVSSYWGGNPIYLADSIPPYNSIFFTEGVLNAKVKLIDTLHPYSTDKITSYLSRRVVPFHRFPVRRVNDTVMIQPGRPGDCLVTYLDTLWDNGVIQKIELSVKWDTNCGGRKDSSAYFVISDISDTANIYKADTIVFLGDSAIGVKLKKGLRIDTLEIKNKYFWIVQGDGEDTAHIYKPNIVKILGEGGISSTLQKGVETDTIKLRDRHYWVAEANSRKSTDTAQIKYSNKLFFMGDSTIHVSLIKGGVDTVRFKHLYVRDTTASSTTPPPLIQCDDQLYIGNFWIVQENSYNCFIPPVYVAPYSQYNYDDGGFIFRTRATSEFLLTPFTKPYNVFKVKGYVGERHFNKRITINPFLYIGRYWSKGMIVWDESASALRFNISFYTSTNPSSFITSYVSDTFKIPTQWIGRKSLPIQDLTFDYCYDSTINISSIPVSGGDMVKHGINDTTWHSDYPLKLTRGGTGKTTYNQGDIPYYKKGVLDSFSIISRFGKDSTYYLGLTDSTPVWKKNIYKYPISKITDTLQILKGNIFDYLRTYPDTNMTTGVIDTLVKWMPPGLQDTLFIADTIVIDTIIHHKDTLIIRTYVKADTLKYFFYHDTTIYVNISDTTDLRITGFIHNKVGLNDTLTIHRSDGAKYSVVLNDSTYKYWVLQSDYQKSTDTAQIRDKDKVLLKGDNNIAVTLDKGAADTINIKYTRLDTDSLYGIRAGLNDTIFYKRTDGYVFKYIIKDSVIQPFYFDSLWGMRSGLGDTIRFKRSGDNKTFTYYIKDSVIVPVYSDSLWGKRTGLYDTVFFKRSGDNKIFNYAIKDSVITPLYTDSLYGQRVGLYDTIYYKRPSDNKVFKYAVKDSVIMPSYIDSLWGGSTGLNDTLRFKRSGDGKIFTIPFRDSLVNITHGKIDTLSTDYYYNVLRRLSLAKSTGDTLKVNWVEEGYWGVKDTFPTTFVTEIRGDTTFYETRLWGFHRGLLRLIDRETYYTTGKRNVESPIARPMLVVDKPPMVTAGDCEGYNFLGKRFVKKQGTTEAYSFVYQSLIYPETSFRNDDTYYINIFNKGDSASIMHFTISLVATSYGSQTSSEEDCNQAVELVNPIYSDTLGWYKTSGYRTVLFKIADPSTLLYPNTTDVCGYRKYELRVTITDTNYIGVNNDKTNIYMNINSSYGTIAKCDSCGRSKKDTVYATPCGEVGIKYDFGTMSNLSEANDIYWYTAQIQYPMIEFEWGNVTDKSYSKFEAPFVHVNTLFNYEWSLTQMDLNGNIIGTKVWTSIVEGGPGHEYDGVIFRDMNGNGLTHYHQRIHAERVSAKTKSHLTLKVHYNERSLQDAVNAQMNEFLRTNPDRIFYNPNNGMYYTASHFANGNVRNVRVFTDGATAQFWRDSWKALDDSWENFWSPQNGVIYIKPLDEAIDDLERRNSLCESNRLDPFMVVAPPRKDTLGNIIIDSNAVKIPQKWFFNKGDMLYAATSLPDSLSRLGMTVADSNKVLISKNGLPTWQSLSAATVDTTFIITKWDTTTMLSKYLDGGDTVSLSNRINTKQNTITNLSDTIKYIERADTSAMLSTYSRKDTTVAHNIRLNSIEGAGYVTGTHMQSMQYGGTGLNTYNSYGLLKANGTSTSLVTDNSANWNTSYNWGNHALAGYGNMTQSGTINTEYLPRMYNGVYIQSNIRDLGGTRPWYGGAQIALLSDISGAFESPLTFNSPLSRNVNTISVDLSSKANVSHAHAAGEITSGLLARARGGTNNNNFTLGKFIAYDNGLDRFYSSDYDQNSFVPMSYFFYTSPPGSYILLPGNGGTGNHTYTTNKFIAYDGNKFASTSYDQTSFLSSSGSITVGGVVDCTSLSASYGVYGVAPVSQSGSAIFGDAKSSQYGVEGKSVNGVGVYGYSMNSAGVATSNYFTANGQAGISVTITVVTNITYTTRNDVVVNLSLTMPDGPASWGSSTMIQTITITKRTLTFTGGILTANEAYSETFQINGNSKRFVELIDKINVELIDKIKININNVIKGE